MVGPFLQSNANILIKLLLLYSKMDLLHSEFLSGKTIARSLVQAAITAWAAIHRVFYHLQMETDLHTSALSLSAHGRSSQALFIME